jgi:uncharacterized protein YigE (DUF2233 family)
VDWLREIHRGKGRSSREFQGKSKNFHLDPGGVYFFIGIENRPEREYKVFLGENLKYEVPAAKLTAPPEPL